MKIKRFFASDMREALRLVKDELGADAVILSNSSSDEGVEVVAAKDYDEQVIQQAVDKEEAAFETELEKTLAQDKVSINWNSPPEQDYRKDYMPSKKKMVNREMPKPTVKMAAKKKEWIEDPAIKAVKHELDMMRHEFRTQLNALSWADQTQQNPVRIDIIKRLLDTGFSKKLSLKLAETVGTDTELESAWISCLNIAASSLPVLDDELLDKGGVVAFFGPTGVGKTTTIAKIAARFRMRHGANQLALITTDNYRIGAHEQLSNFARILEVPMRVASSHEELDDALTDFIDKRLVLIDTAGMSQRDLRLTEQFKLLRDDKFEIKNYLVLSATTETRAMREVMNTFEDIRPKACILTKLDETDCPGSALSAIIENQIPLSYVTDGQRVPEDLHYPDAEKLMASFVESTVMPDEEDIALSVLLGGHVQHATV